MSDFQIPRGITFISPNEIDAANLSTVLAKIAAFIQARSSNAKLKRYDDWWEHDGLHFYRKPLSINDLFAIVRSPKSLLESMSGDFNVFVGIYSEELSIYVRFYVEWNDDETQLVGRIDVTVPVNLVDLFRKEIVSVSKTNFKEMDSYEYYKSIIC